MVGAEIAFIAQEDSMISKKYVWNTLLFNAFYTGYDVIDTYNITMAVIRKFTRYTTKIFYKTVQFNKNNIVIQKLLGKKNTGTDILTAIVRLFGKN